MLVHERLADFIAVPVEAPIPVVGDTVATKEIAADEVKSVKLQNFEAIDQNIFDKMGKINGLWRAYP